MQYLNKKAFDRGFKDFKSGNIYNPPYNKNSLNYKEWLRGQNYAFFIVLKRNETREQYRQKID